MLNNAFGAKSVFGMHGTGVTNAATVTDVVDTLGYDHASIDVIMTTADATTDQPSVIKWQESDDSTTYSNITALTGGTAANTSGFFVIPAGDTANVTAIRFNMDLRARKRYLKLSVSPRTTMQITMAGRLGRAEQSPQTTTAAGISAFVNV